MHEPVHTSLVEAIRRRDLAAAEETAQELPKLDQELALAIVLLMGDERDARYERALVRWLGHWLADNPGIGLEHAIDLAVSLDDLSGASPDVARSQAAFLMRSVGSDGPADVLERW